MRIHRGSFLSVVYLRWATFLLSATLQCNALMYTNMSPVEAVLLQPRLERIEAAVERKYEAVIKDEDTGSSCRTFIFPGAGGVDPLVEELNLQMDGSKIIDWLEHRGTVLAAAYDAEAVGEAVATLLLRRQDSNQQDFHFVGISVGAFGANAAATHVYRRLGGSNKILNTDDPVPTTNDPLPYCYCVDVTAAPERRSFVPLPGDSMHSWPVAYFARHFQEPSGTLQKGSIIKIGDS